MIIGIDGNEANVKKRDGVHQYAFEIFWGLYRLKNEWKDKHKIIIYLSKPPRNDLPRETLFWEYKVLPGGRLWTITKLMPHLLAKPLPEVFFAPSHYLPPLTAMPKVYTIHDLGYLKFSGQFKKYDFWQLKYWTAISTYISKYIISISESTKKDIVRHYKFASKKVFVVHHGYDKTRYNTNISSTDVRRVIKKYKLVSDYIFYIGTLKPSKNIKGIIKAFAFLKEKKEISEKTRLVIGGRKGWLYQDIFQTVKDLAVQDSVFFTDYVDEDDKPALMFGARMLVSPSFWEGFGMHILESMACGTPVVVSRAASIPEVVGKAGIYVNPNDFKDIAKGIKKTLNLSPKEYNRLREISAKRAKMFSWEKTARKTLKVLEKAVK